MDKAVVDQSAVNVEMHDNEGVDTINEMEDAEEVSLRDYFAAQALGGVLELMEDEAEDADDFGSFAFLAARRAYALADAMMIARDLDFDDDDLEDEEEDEEDEGDETETPEAEGR